MSMFALSDGKTEINPCQIVSAHQDKGGDTWTLYMADDKRFTVSKHEMNLLRPLVCGGGSSGGSGGGATPITVPPVYTIHLTGTAAPPQ